ncbi:MAG TPA: imidazole glycerol phosphate synthase subunit HisH [Rhodocyclaceae bacterium]|nr:imidazole glycerol phosphate synthase subunit HisH [Rhodocyclaceae bacterium]
MPRLAVIDYGMGNLRSVAKAFEHAGTGFDIVVTSDPDFVRAADRVVVPGQGAMPDCMAQLADRGLADAVREAARTKPFLGICIGLQMLFDYSEEGDCPGLGLLQGRVRHFPREAMHDAQGGRLKVPHMGWNEVHQRGSHPLWAGIPDGCRFYFVHSYFVQPADPALTAAHTGYGLDFTCAIATDNIFAVQFHPEKSAHAGLTLLANFLRWRPG